MESGVFEMREHIGQKFYRDHPNGSEAHKAYMMVKGREQKRLFRAQWAKETFGDVVRSKTRTSSFQHVDTTTGVYRPFGAIVMKEGGWQDPAAVRGAKLMAAKCCIMGGQSVSRNPLTERLEFFHLRREVSDKLVEAWTMCEHESKKISSASGSGAAADGGSAGGLACGSSGKKADEGTAVGGGSSGAGSGAAVVVGAKPVPEPAPKRGKETNPSPKPKSDKPPAEKPVHAKALRLKSQWLSTAAAAATLIKRIKNETVEWQWASNAGNLGRLETSVKIMEDSKTDFVQEFLIQDMATFKKSLAPERLHTELSTFLGLKPVVDSVQSEVDRLVSMHKASK
jgi:hypothetical protein